jgi:2-iminobutanoate/2-iminopropanoate deaminase
MQKLLGDALMVVALVGGLILASNKQVIRPNGTKPDAPYSPGILVDGTLYVSGQGGEDVNGKLPSEFEAEVRQALDNVGVVLKEAGMTPDDVVSVQVYLTDGALFQRMNAVYKTYFKDPRPTRTTVVVARLVGAGRIEITATARK